MYIRNIQLGKKIRTVAWMLATVVGIGFFSACEKDDQTFKGPYHVRFTDSIASARESYPRVIKIQLHNAGPQLAEAIAVNYVVGGTAREGIDYTILGTKGIVTIPANQSLGEIQLRLINNSNDRLESQTIIFTLADAKPASLNVGFGKNNNIGRRMTYTIQDDCILAGHFIGTRKEGNTTITTPDVRVTSTDCKELTLSNWNVGLNDLFNFDADEPTLRFIDKKDNSIEIPAQTNAYFDSDVELSGNGSWNPQNGNLLLNIQLKVSLTDPARDTVISIPTLTFIPEKN